MKTRFRMKTFLNFATRCLPLLSAFAVLVGCRLSQTPETPPLTLPQRITWNGNPPSRSFDSILVGVDSNAYSSVLRIHFFEFPGPDSVRLRFDEYSGASGAYSAFQRSASLEEMGQGWYRQGSDLVFYQGEYLGTLSCASGERISDEALKGNLRLQGEELISKPGEFAAFPLLGRIPTSERVIPTHFLGCEWKGPVFTVSYRCHGDTATAFRSYAQDRDSVRSWIKRWSGKTDTLNWGRELHFKGRDDFRRPLIFWLFSEGAMGFSGCSDSELAEEYAQKLQKTAVLWPHP